MQIISTFLHKLYQVVIGCSKTIIFIRHYQILDARAKDTKLVRKIQGIRIAASRLPEYRSKTTIIVIISHAWKWRRNVKDTIIFVLLKEIQLA